MSADNYAKMSADSYAKDYIHSLYVQDAWQLADEFTLYVGARQDWWKMRGGEFELK